MTLEHREDILCTGEDGRRVMVRRFARKIANPRLGSGPDIDGSSDYRTSDGQYVNPKDDGTFAIFGTNEMLTPIQH